MRSFIKPTPLTLLIPLLILVGCSHTIPATVSLDGAAKRRLQSGPDTRS
jgi:hypothetical protein